jgi:hypothetical protein
MIETNRYSSLGSKRHGLTIGNFVTVEEHTASTRKNGKDYRYQVIEFVIGNHNVKICDVNRKVYILRADRLKRAPAPSYSYLYSQDINFHPPTRSNIVFHIDHLDIPLQYITEYSKTGPFGNDRFVVVYDPSDKFFKHILMSKDIGNDANNFQLVELVDAQRCAILSNFQFIQPVQFNGERYDTAVHSMHPNYKHPLLTEGHLYWTTYNADQSSTDGSRIVKFQSLDLKFLNAICLDLSSMSTVRIPCSSLNIMTPIMWSKAYPIITNAMGYTGNMYDTDVNTHQTTVCPFDGLKFKAYNSAYAEYDICTLEHFKVYFKAMVEPHLPEGESMDDEHVISVPISSPFGFNRGDNFNIISVPISNGPTTVTSDGVVVVDSLPNVNPNLNNHIKPVSTDTAEKGHFMKLMDAFTSNMKNSAKNAGSVAVGRTMSNNLARFVKSKNPMVAMFLGSPAGRTGEMILANVLLAIVDVYKPDSVGYRLAAEAYCTSTSATVCMNGADFVNEFLDAMFAGVDVAQFETMAKAAQEAAGSEEVPPVDSSKK